ncbi:hypothetical protein FOZ61_000733 [Perkinsus olseni]|uniref:Uncharacterized protein n=1 Tax=Perkinsus olseni TaxID=32597 RepID=A0A7J6KTT0_PEROL|nr:hypothetical protein FOZ61_000733 [Perkinsus olseni]
MGFITALVPPDGCNVTAAGEQLQTFGSPHAAVIEEYGILTTGEADDRRLTGCSAMRLSCSIHCNGFPHVETVAHCLSGTPFEPFVRGVAGRPRKIGVFDCLPHGTLETAVLVRPSVTRLGDSGDTYPAGSPEDAVVTKQSLEDAVQRLRLPSDVNDSPVSLVVSVEDVSAPIVGSWENWPYLTTEAVLAMINGDLVDADGRKLRVNHFRTNLPSVERMDSGGGMWNHCLIFGIHSERSVRWLESNDLVDGEGRSLKETHRSTIGEGFCIPDGVTEGIYKLLCATAPLQLDASFVTPLLFDYYQG